MTPDSLSELMAQAARELEGRSSSEDTMQAAVEVAVRDIDGAQAAALSLVIRRSRVETLAATSRQARLADDLQYELAEGPCLDAVRAERVVHSPDLSRERRWPRWAARAARETGFRSLMSFQLFTAEDRVGALNVYSGAVGSFDETDRDHGLALAAHISVAVRSAQEIEQLQAALDSRTVIAQAVGILMERYDLTPESAFSVLSRVSSTTNTRLRDLAGHLCSTGKLPSSGGGNTGDSSRQARSAVHPAPGPQPSSP